MRWERGLRSNESSRKNRRNAFRCHRHDKYIETSDFISSTESEITEIENSGVKTPKSDELLERAKSELNNNNFEKAKDLVNKARWIALERKEGYDLAFDSTSVAERVFNEINLSQTFFKPNISLFQLMSY